MILDCNVYAVRRLLRPAIAILAVLWSNGTWADVVIANGRVFSATEGARVNQANLLVVGDRIASISTEHIHAPGVPVIDATGKTVLPGLIDTHFHLFFDRQSGKTWFPSSHSEARRYIDAQLRQRLEDYLEQGFTSIASPLDFWPLIREVRERLASGELRGPRLFIAGGVFTTPGEHAVCAGQTWCAERVSVPVAGPRQARERVRKYVEGGVDFVVFDGLHGGPSSVRPDIALAVIDEAHKHGRQILLHGVDAADVESFVKWGVDGFLTPPRVTHDIDGTLLRFAGERGLPLAITVEELERPKIRDNILVMLAHGAVPVFGPDLAGTETAPRDILATTSQALSEIGLSNEEVLLSVTRYAAQVMLGQNDFGTLEPGNTADIIIINGNPLKDRGALQELELVIKAGQILVDNRQQ